MVRTERIQLSSRRHVVAKEEAADDEILTAP
jgi:hypothetical protein